MPDVYILEHAVVTEKRKPFGNHWETTHRYVDSRWVFDSYEKAVKYRDDKPYVMLDGFGGQKVSPYTWNSNRERKYDEFQIHRLEVN